MVDGKLVQLALPVPTIPVLTGGLNYGRPLGEHVVKRTSETETGRRSRKRATSQADARTADVNADHARLQAFDKTMELLKAGDVPGAKAYAERSGETIPPEVLQNADVRAHFVVAWVMAGEMYPNSPRARHERMHIYLTSLAYRMYQDDVAMSEWLIKNGVAKDSNDAWQMVWQSRQNMAAWRAQIFNNALRTNGGDPKLAEEITTQALQFIMQPAAAPAPGRRRSMH